MKVVNLTIPYTVIPEDEHAPLAILDILLTEK